MLKVIFKDGTSAIYKKAEVLFFNPVNLNSRHLGYKIRQPHIKYVINLTEVKEMLIDYEE